MPRKPRIDLPGFHHVINRGVNRENVFLHDEDKNEFLKIVAAARKIYHLTVHSFCVLDNHYHLLIETCRDNLSLALRYINSQYAVYFNKKMGRVGPLWQGRFKSWYVTTDDYLWLLIRYIEMNPVKSGLSAAIGEYPFSSSYFIVQAIHSDLLDASLLYDKDIHTWLFPLSDRDIGQLSEYCKINFKKRGGEFIQSKQIKLSDYFSHKTIESRNESIYKALLDGYIQGDIARYLNISAVAVSKIVRTERNKRELFAKVRDRGLFWSYAPDIDYDSEKSELLIETVLKYGDVEEIGAVYNLFGKRKTRHVWETRLRNDSRFRRLNYFLARVLFKMDMEAADFAEIKNTRGEKFRLLAG